MQGYAQKCFERCCEHAHETVDQLHKVAPPCVDDNQCKTAEMETVGELSET